MKKTNKENPITTFRKNFENRSKTVMSSLKKANKGIIAGPQTEMQSMLSNAMNSQPPIPRPNRPSNDEMMREMMSNSMSNVNAANAMKQQQMQMQNQSSSGAMQSGMKDVRSTPKDAVRYSMDLDKQKKGGVTKATKFAALAPPYNKATAADRIVGAKKNARKKK